jgi:hypothetical protein
MYHQKLTEKRTSDGGNDQLLSGMAAEEEIADMTFVQFSRPVNRPLSTDSHRKCSQLSRFKTYN